MTIGLSRRSSVPALKLKPEQPDRFVRSRRSRRSRAAPAAGCCRGSPGSPGSRGRLPWRGTGARGRPWAGTSRRTRNPASGSTDDRFSFSSRQKMSMTSWLSMLQPLAEVADLVRERDLERVPGIAGVLDHLGGADAGRDDAARRPWRRAPSSARRRIGSCGRPASAADYGNRGSPCPRAGTRD